MKPLTDNQLFSFDMSFLEDEQDTWVQGREPAETPPMAASSDVCACRRHPSGAVKPPNPNCLKCKGTGLPVTSEVYDTVFDGKGNFTQTQPESPDNAPDAARNVSFRH